MKFTNVKTALSTVACSLILMPIAAAQCQRGGGQSPGASNMTNTQGAYMQMPFGPMGYNQMGMNNGYNQTGFAPNAYNQFASQAAAAEQYNRNLKQFAAMQVQAQAMMVRTQMAQAKTMRKQMDQASSEMRKSAQKDRAEAIAAREEREAARRSKSYDGPRSETRLASTIK